MDKQIRQREKVRFEYELSSQSIPMIWEAVATAPGMASWFADQAAAEGKLFTFSWGRHETRQAELINCRQSTYVRFHWTDEEPGTYFEIRIHKNELHTPEPTHSVRCASNSPSSSTASTIRWKSPTARCARPSPLALPRSAPSIIWASFSALSVPLS